MTDKNLINGLYRRFRRRPATLDGRNLRLLADFIVDERGISLQDDDLVFTETPPDAPFHKIPLENINGVADLGKLLAIVLNSSIIFFNKETLETTIHIKQPNPVERILSRLRRDS